MVNGLEATNWEENFLRANVLYTQGNFQEALDAYTAIPDPKGWATLYNMGACYYELEDYVQALVHFKRAARTAANEPSIKQAVKNCYQHLGVTYNPTLWERGCALLMIFSIRIWQVIFLALFFIVCAFIYFFKNKKIIVSGMLTFVWSLVGICLWTRVSQQTAQYALSLQETPLFIGMNDKFDSYQNLKKGSMVKVMAQHEPWVKVKGEGYSGWTYSKFLAYL